MWVGLQHRDGFAEDWEGAGRFASRLFSSFFVRFELWMTLSDRVDGMWQPATLAFRNLIDFRSFRPLPRNCPQLSFK